MCKRKCSSRALRNNLHAGLPKGFHAYFAGYLLGGWVVWLVAPFCATVGYVLLLAGEMGLAQALRR